MDDETADAAMREMMGFGSFGSNKRQKLNSGNQNRPKKPPTTSSNSTPLGTSRLQAVSSSSLSMIPSSLPISGCSPPGSPIWIAAKLPNAVSTPNITETNERAPTQPIPIDTVTGGVLAQSSAPDTPNPNPLNSQASNSSLSATANPFNPNSNTTQHYSASDVRSDPAYWSALSAKPPQEREVGYTSPWTGAALTRAELAEYGRGKKEVQEDGSTVSVFFKPSFLATQDDLWGKWEKEREAKISVV